MSLPELCYADWSARGRLRLTGRDRQSFLQGMVTNDVASLAPGAGVYAFLLDATGHVLSDARVLCGEGYLLLDVEPEMASFVATTLDRYLVMEKCRITDVSADLAEIFLAGPKAPAALAALFGLVGGEAWTEGANSPFSVAGDASADCIAAAFRLVRGPAFTLYVPADRRESVQERLAAAGAVAIDAADLEGERIAAGIPRFGADIDSKILAPETAQQARAIHPRKGCYIGQEIIARIDARGHTNRSFAGFRLREGAPPPAGAEVQALNKTVGRVTSAATPGAGGVIALGYLRNEFAPPGTPVTIDGREAHVSALPFEAV